MNNATPSAASEWLFKQAKGTITGGDEEFDKIPRRDRNPFQPSVRGPAVQGRPIRTTAEHASRAALCNQKVLVNKINTYYDSLSITVAECMSMLTDLSKERKGTRLNYMHFRLEKVLHSCVSKVPYCLKSLHSSPNAQFMARLATDEA